MSSWTISGVEDFVAAAINAVRPSLALASNLAPLLMSSLTISGVEDPAAANISAVQPLLSLASTWAPLSMSSWTAGMSLPAAALCRGVISWAAISLEIISEVMAEITIRQSTPRSFKTTRFARLVCPNDSTSPGCCSIHILHG